jgi:LysR family transcriptional regulator, benzoate and cis,cis-muconate-responsive activator of ben and cat genes
MLGPFLEMQMYAAVLAEEGSFIRAARRLRISQSNLTRKIAHLEKMVGVKIFERSTRRLGLTATGRFLLPKMQSSLRHAERAWELARYHGRIEAGPIRLGYSPYVHSRLLPKLHRLDISELDGRHIGSADATKPGVVLKTAATPELVERVLQGKLDAAIGVCPVEDRDLWIEPLARESFCVCIPKNHDLARHASVPVRDFDGERLFWIPREMHPAFYDSTVEYIRSTGANPVLHEVYPAMQVIDIVAHGFGLALLPGASARLNHMGVVFKPVADRLLQIETVMFARREHLQGKFQDFASVLLSQLRS